MSHADVLCCTACGQKLTRRGWNRHRGTAACDAVQVQRAMRERGLEHVGDTGLLAQLKRLGAPGDRAIGLTKNGKRRRVRKVWYFELTWIVLARWCLNAGDALDYYLEREDDIKRLYDAAVARVLAAKAEGPAALQNLAALLTLGDQL